MATVTAKADPATTEAERFRPRRPTASALRSASDKRRPPAVLAGEISPEDLSIIQKRQEWRLRVAGACLDSFEAADRGGLPGAAGRGELEALSQRYARVADCVRGDLAKLLVTVVVVPELEAIRYQVNYFLEEVIRYVRTDLQRRGQERSPLETLDAGRLGEEVAAALAQSPEALLRFVGDVVRLESFELEVRAQRKRIRLLLGGDRQLASFSSNEAIFEAELDEFWAMLDGFLSVASYIDRNLPPLLDEVSSYPGLEEELRTAAKQLQGLSQARIAPLAKAYETRRALDDPLERLERALREASQVCFHFVGGELVSLGHWAEASADGAGLDPELFSRALRGLVARLGELRDERLPPALAIVDRALGEGVRQADLGRLREELGEVASFLGEVIDATLEPTATLLARLASEDRGPSGAEVGELAHANEAIEQRLTAAYRRLDRASRSVQALRHRSIRQLREDFCALVGEFRTFLQTGFAHIAAKDPRSSDSSYHFFLREFSDEAHQALHLLKEITALEVFMMGLQRFHVGGLPLTPENLARILRVLFSDQRQEMRIPSGEGWRMLAGFLDSLRGELVPRLQKVCTMEGIRFEDRDHLSTWARELHESCTRCLALHELGYGMLQELRRLRVAPAGDGTDGETVKGSFTHIVVARTCRDMQRALQAICMTLTAAVPYVGIMKDGIERRASVFFHRQQMLQEADRALAPGAPSR